MIRWTILSLLMVSTAMGMGGGRLDSLIIKSQKLEQKGIKGFIYQQQQQAPVQLMHPDSLFKIDPDTVQPEMPEPSPLVGIGTAGGSGNSRGASGGSSTPTIGVSRHRGAYVSFREYIEDIKELETRIIDLEKQLIQMQSTDEKALIVMENLQNHSEITNRGINFMTKAIEILTALAGLISALGVGVGVKKLTAKKPT